MAVGLLLRIPYADKTDNNALYLTMYLVRPFSQPQRRWLLTGVSLGSSSFFRYTLSTSHGRKEESRPTFCDRFSLPFSLRTNISFSSKSEHFQHNPQLISLRLPSKATRINLRCQHYRQVSHCPLTTRHQNLGDIKCSDVVRSSWRWNLVNFSKPFNCEGFKNCMFRS